MTTAGTTGWVPSKPSEHAWGLQRGLLPGGKIRFPARSGPNAGPKQPQGSQSARPCKEAAEFGYLVSCVLISSAQSDARLHSRSYEPHVICPSDPSPHPPCSSHMGPLFLFPKNLELFPAPALCLAGSFSSLRSSLEHQLPRKALADPQALAST